MLRKFLLFIFALAATAAFPAAAAPGSLSVLSSATATPLLLGESHRIHSGLLAEEREYWMRIPTAIAGETPPESVTVIYVLDAEKLFAPTAALAAFLEGSRLSSLGPAVVVGVVSGDRTQDFTPTPSNARRDGTVDENAKQVGGGAESFYHFLTTELRASAESHLPQNTRVARRVLVGHSYAGLFALHVLLWHPNAFEGYAALDPSVWWDRGALVARAVKAGARTVEKPAPELYVAFAAQTRPETRYHLERADDLRAKAFPVLNDQGVRTSIRFFHAEVHGTIAPPGVFDALKTLFPARPEAGSALHPAPVETPAPRKTAEN